MGTHLRNRIFEKIILQENLLKAFHAAAKEKRFRSNVLVFEERLGANIALLHTMLKNKTYRHGNYRQFHIYDPKHRIISAAPFADRIVHHAICNIIEPIFDRTFIYDSFACRKEKGTHKNTKRLQQFLQNQKLRYALKCDIAKYFPSINHKILLTILENAISDKDTLWLLKEIIGSHESGDEFEHLFPEDSHFRMSKPRGIPVGNLTSQLFANIYLNAFDHFVKEKLGVKYYLRYVDDFLILGESKQYLHSLIPPIKKFLYEHRHLTMHPKKIRVFPTRVGVDFTGYIVFKDFMLLRAKNVRRFRKRLHKFKRLLRENKISEKKVQTSITCWLAHAQHADTYRLRKAIFGKPLVAGDQKEIAAFVKSLEYKPGEQMRLF